MDRSPSTSAPALLTNKAFKKQIVDEVRASAPAAPRCPHAAECGGCAFQDRAYSAQIAAKQDALERIWADALPGVVAEPIPVVASPNPYEYRTRMDYVAAKGRFGLRRGGKFNYIIDLGECHLIPPSAFAVARAVYEQARALGLPDYNLRSHEGFLRYIVVRRAPQGQLLLALVTASSDNAEAVARLAEGALAQPQVASFHWLVNDKLTDLAFGEPIGQWGAATLPMQVGPRTLQIGPNTFFQNNVHLLLPLLDDVAQSTTADHRPPATDQRLDAAQAVVGRQSSVVVADLYGGVGTIALHLADHVREVVCVESVAESVALARENIASNTVRNVATVEADTLAFLQDQSPGRFDVIVVDPPRTGLGPEVCRELLRLRPGRLVYVSCNPLTQVADAQLLLRRFRLSSLRGYDMFPQTPHLEALAVFDRA